MIAHWLTPLTYNVPFSFAVTVKLAAPIAVCVYCALKLVGLNVNVGAVVSVGSLALTL